MRKFKPSKSEKVVISIRIEDNKLEQIDKIATKANMSRNELIVQCLDFAIDNLEFNK